MRSLSAATPGRFSLTTSTAVLSVLFAFPAHSQTCFRDVIPAGTTPSGDIAGIASTPFSLGAPFSHGFVRARDGSTTTFYVEDVVTFSVDDINPAGTIIGSYIPVSDPVARHGYFRSPDGAITKFDVPGALDTEPLGINPAGTITGFYALPILNSPDVGFLRSADGTLLTFAVPGTTGHTVPTDINPDGAVTGYYDAGAGFSGFLRAADGTFTTFQVGFSTRPVAINPDGIIVGNTVEFIGNTIRNRGFLRHEDGTIDPIEVIGARETDVAAINPSGAVVGRYLIGSGQPTEHAFLRDPDGSMTTFDVPGASATAATTISPSGVIAGNTKIDGCALGFVRSRSGEITTFAIPLAPISPDEVAAGSVGEFRSTAGTIELSRPTLTGSSYTLAYSLAEGGEVAIAVYDVAGRRVAELDQGFRGAGKHQVSWNQTGVAPGIYFLRLKAGASQTSRTIMIRN